MSTGMAYKSTYHEDSDADDEYERSIVTSPTLPPDFESSPTDSEPPSTENTPTTFTHHSGGSHGSPTGVITRWSTDQCADFISGLGLKQYADIFIEEEISGEALISLNHPELKEMGMGSVGHRLSVLKAVYDIKVKQNVRIEPDDYVPLSAETDEQDAPPSQDDISRILRVIKDRDERIHMVETELKHLKEDLNRLTEENRKLREDVLPVIRMAKDRSQPLPTPAEDVLSPPANDRSGSSLSRKFSTKALWLNPAPKNPSPTIHEGRTLSDGTSLDPSVAAMAATSNLAASMGGEHPSARSPHSIAQPSPTSPAYSVQTTNTARTYHRGHVNDDNVSAYPKYSAMDRDQRQPQSAPISRTMRGNAAPTPEPSDPPLSGGSTLGGSTLGGSTLMSNSSTTSASQGSSNPQVEIFKSFRVSIDDPCHKVLPVALKKYNISADWRQYALYIVHGDEERCLGLNERPLILFKQLDKEGRKPMFMLRKHAAPAEGHVSYIGGGAGGARGGDGGTITAAAQPSSGGGWTGDGQQRWAQGGVHLPGGVL